MTRVIIALLTVSTITLSAQRVSAREPVCTDETTPGEPEGVDSFSLQCRNGELEYATAQCATDDAGAVVSCNYQVYNPGAYCAEAVGCNIYFLNDYNEVLDHVYVEEGSSDRDTDRGLWTKTSIACACPEWR